MKHRRPLVYIAAPYTNPEPISNVRKAIRGADALQETGLVVCLVPHLSMAWNLVVWHPAKYWYDYDLHLLTRCDALLRLPGFSSGSDREITSAKEAGIPVFYDKTQLLEWAVKEWKA